MEGSPVAVSGSWVTKCPTEQIEFKGQKQSIWRCDKLEATASVVWGDGEAGPASITVGCEPLDNIGIPEPECTFTASANHTYRSAGSYKGRINWRDNVKILGGAIPITVDVADAPVTIENGEVTRNGRELHLNATVNDTG